MNGSNVRSGSSAAPMSDVCACGHEHTSARLGSCSKFTCPCNQWRPPRAEEDDGVSPKPESAQPEGVAEGVVTGSSSAVGGSAATRSDEYRKALVAIAGSDGSWDVARYAQDVLDDNEQDDYSLNPYAVAIALETLADRLKGLAREHA